MARYRIVQVAQEIFEVQRKGLFGNWYTLTEQVDPYYYTALQFRTAAEAKAYVLGPSYSIVEEFTV